MTGPISIHEDPETHRLFQEQDLMSEAQTFDASDPDASRGVAVHEPGRAPALSGDATLSMIERLASNPNFNPESLRALIDMQERVLDRNARDAFFAALAEMQPELPVIERNGRITIKEKNGERVIQSTPYALWEDTNEAIRPILQRHGFALSFRSGNAADGKLEVTGILSHRQGHRETTTLALMHDSTGSKNSVQAVGSSLSYGKRYAAGALLNLTSRGEDDDGASAGEVEESEAIRAAKASIDESPDLDDWKKKNAGPLEKLSPDEHKIVVAYFNEVKAARKAAAASAAQPAGAS